MLLEALEQQAKNMWVVAVWSPQLLPVEPTAQTGQEEMRAQQARRQAQEGLVLQARRHVQEGLVLQVRRQAQEGLLHCYGLPDASSEEVKPPETPRPDWMVVWIEQIVGEASEKQNQKGGRNQPSKKEAALTIGNQNNKIA